MKLPPLPEFETVVSGYDYNGMLTREQKCTRAQLIADRKAVIEACIAECDAEANRLDEAGWIGDARAARNCAERLRALLAEVEQ